MRPFIEKILSFMRASSEPEGALSDSLSVAAALPEGSRLYVVGDIHGRLDLLNQLLEAIERDLALFPHSQTRLVFLGDYVDRGPQSAQVLDRLIDADFPTSETSVFLRGNHEAALLEFLLESRHGASWLTSYGGREALLSYGVNVPLVRFTPDILNALQAEFLDKIPASHRLFLESTRFSYEEGGYFFAHAGVRPDVPLSAQKTWDLITIREPFLSWPKPLEKLVVHGHSIAESIELHPHRMGIDTGAYASGILTALVLEGANRRVLQTIQIA